VDAAPLLQRADSLIEIGDLANQGGQTVEKLQRPIASVGMIRGYHLHIALHVVWYGWAVLVHGITPSVVIRELNVVFEARFR